MSKSRINPDTVISVAGLLEQPGETRSVSRDIAIPADFEVALTRFTSPVHVELDCNILVNGVLVRGDIQTSVQQQCCLCLEDTPETHWSQTVMEMFTTLDVDPDAKDDGRVIEEEAIDIDVLIRDVLSEIVPQTAQCKPDCLGLCSECGSNWNVKQCNHQNKVVADPRWTALEGLNLSDSE